MLAVLMVGLLAGLMLGTGIEQRSLRALDAFAWVTEHQVMDAVFSRLMPPFWNATAAMLLIATLFSPGRSRWCFAAGAALLILSLVVTVRIEVPMNRAIAHWNPAAAPANWSAIRDRWLAFHALRTVSGITAFVAATAGLLLRPRL
jgi:uncharacterized membrane protein